MFFPNEAIWEKTKDASFDLAEKEALDEHWENQYANEKEQYIERRKAN